MVIRSYTAESVAAALKQVRTEMGGDAVVLKTRMVDDDRGRKQYEVTACLDKPSIEQANRVLRESSDTAEPQTPTPPATTDQSRFDVEDIVPEAQAEPATDSLEQRLKAIESKLDQLLRAGLMTSPEPQLLRDMREMFEAADMPFTFVESFVEEITTQDGEPTLESARSLLRDKLMAMVAPDAAFKKGDRIVVIGPAGSGKTSVLGKLAAQMLGNKLTVKLSSLDSSKVGAIDEIESYGELLGVETGSERDRADAKANKDCVLLSDSGALATGDENAQKLQARVKKLAPTYCLAVVSALMRSSDVAAFARTAASVGATHLVLTMTDQTERWGALVTAADSSGLKVLSVTDAPSGHGKLLRPDPEKIAADVIPEEDYRE